MTLTFCEPEMIWWYPWCDGSSFFLYLHVCGPKSFIYLFIFESVCKE